MVWKWNGIVLLQKALKSNGVTLHIFLREVYVILYT